MRGQLLEFARPYRRRFLLGVLLLVLTNAFTLLLPWLLRGAIAAIERGAAAAVVGWYATAMIAAALVQAVIRTGSRLTILGASRHIVFDIRNRFFAHLERLGASYFDSHRTGDIMSRGVNDLLLLRSLYGPGVLNLLNTALVFTGGVALMLSLDLTLTLWALAPFPILFLVVSLLSRRVFAQSVAVQEQLGALSTRAQENLSGIQQVKAYVQEEREAAAFRELGAEFRRRSLAMATLRGLMLALIAGFAGLGTLVVLFVGGQHVLAGRMTFADFVAFNATLGLLAWPTVALGWIVNVFQRGVGAMQRIQEVLAAVPDISPAGETGADGPPLDGAIEIRGLTFRFGGAQGAALTDLDLRVERGSRVAIVGEVGSGKSTLVNLLARVYPCPPGTIFIAGEDLAALPVGRVRRSIGYVPQEAFLFSRSLRDNIALGRPDASDEELSRAVALAGLTRDLGDFPDGLETIVGERGFTLSGGQRQRVALARALLTNPRLVLLDDALSSVDADTERGILEALGRDLRGRTCLLISHRFSTLAGADRILVFAAGRIVEDGTHADLLGRDGIYARLFRRHLLQERLEEVS